MALKRVKAPLDKTAIGFDKTAVGFDKAAIGLDNMAIGLARKGRRGADGCNNFERASGHS